MYVVAGQFTYSVYAFDIKVCICGTDTEYSNIVICICKSYTIIPCLHAHTIYPLYHSIDYRLINIHVEEEEIEVEIEEEQCLSLAVLCGVTI